MGSAVDKLPGGPVYLTELDAPTNASAPFYAAQVREISVRRQVRDLGARLQQRAETDLDQAPEDLVADVCRLADTISTPDRHGDVRTALEKVIDIAKHGEPAATPTPWTSLTEMLGEFYPGQLVTFGARPGVGKSIALENIATHIVHTTGRYVAYCSLEMAASEVLQRTLAHTAGVDLTRLRRGMCDDRDWQKISNSTDLIGQLPYRFQDFRPQTMTDIWAHARETAQEAKRLGRELGAVVVDYVQLIKGTSTNRNITRQQEVGSFTRELKNLAGELRSPSSPAPSSPAPARTAPPASRSCPTSAKPATSSRTPTSSCSSMRKRSRTPAASSRPARLDLIVAKQRSGPTGTRRVRKAGHYARIYEG